MALLPGILQEDLHRFTLEEYWRLIDTGGFEQEPRRMELIDGLLLEMSPKSPEHENVLNWLLSHIHRALDPQRWDVRAGSPITTGRSEPEPDVTVVPWDAERPRHPATAALIIEIAHSSHRRDLITKPPVFAAADVDVYWVVDLDRGVVVEHREPGPEGYALVRELSGNDELDAGHVGLDPVPVAEVIAASLGRRLG